MAAHVIDTTLLEGLAHRSAEIRIETFRAVNSQLQNNILFARPGPSQEELSVVNLDHLVRHLLRWFQFRPVACEAEVLNLLILIFNRRDFLRHIAKEISIVRLKKEVTKLHERFASSQSAGQIQRLFQILIDYEKSILVDVASTTGSILGMDSVEPSTSLSMSSLGEKTRSQVSSTAPSKESFWEKLEGLDLDTFNGIAAELSVFKEPQHLCKVLSFLRTNIDDYPPEYFLQSPKILEKLLNPLMKVDTERAVEILLLIRWIVNALKERWIEAMKWRDLQKVSDKERQPTSGIAESQAEESRPTSAASSYHRSSASSPSALPLSLIQRFPLPGSVPAGDFTDLKKPMNLIIRSATSYFESVLTATTMPIIPVFNENMYLVLDIANFISATKSVCEIHLNELMNMMAKVARKLRSSQNPTSRLLYMVTIYTINTLIASIDTRNISTYCANNLWDLECDVALLDMPLKLAQPRIYELIMSNRKQIVEEDEQLTLLMKSQGSWRSVCQLFKNWHEMSISDVIANGLEALSTIRIHQSIQLVDILMHTIRKSLGKPEMAEAVEELFLRLLSIELPDIRQRVYEIAAKLVGKRLHGESSAPGIGIPLTSEIFTEVVCFGLSCSDEKVQESSRLIVFGVLRAKLTIADSWPEILELVKPVLPLATCTAFANFALDVFQENSGFDDFELKQSWARFLYCTDSSVQTIALKKLLVSLDMADLVEIVPNNFCIITPTDLQLPDSSIGFDLESYNNTQQVLKEMDRNDHDLLQTVLLQLSVLMNSRELCVKSHDDNLWVFFMAQLDMGFPDIVVMRKLTVNILLKWVTCVTSFRIYLANEPTVLDFLVKTLVYYQEEPTIKREATQLLFMLLFSDFVVPTERGVSMPAILTQLQHPLRFDQHWVDSPFNQITALEELDEVLEANREVGDIQGITLRFLRFGFAIEWFGEKFGEIQQNVDYYGSSRSTLLVPPKLQLTPDDLQILHNSTSSKVVDDLCAQLNNAPPAEETKLLQLLSTLLMMIPDDSLTSQLNRNLQKLEVKEFSQKQLLKIYQQIIPSLSDECIVTIFGRSFITKIIMNDPEMENDVHIETLKVIATVINQCKSRRSLMDVLMKSFERQFKVHLPTRIVEKLASRLNETKWYETSLVTKTMLVVLRNTLTIMPVNLDDAWYFSTFVMLLQATFQLYKLHLNHLKASAIPHVNSGTLKYIFEILATVGGSIRSLTKLDTTLHKNLLLWVKPEWRKNKALAWNVIGQLTKRKEGYETFCKGFEETGTSLLEEITSSLAQSKLLTRLDQQAIALVVGNILEFGEVQREKKDLKRVLTVVRMLIKLGTTPAWSYLIRKMIHADFPGIAELVVQQDLIANLLSDRQNMSDGFETISNCYNFKPLKEHVAEIVTRQVNTSFVGMMSSTERKFNQNALNLLLILMQSDAGLLRVFRALSETTGIDCLMIALHENLRPTTTHSDLMFQLGFWNSLLDAGTRFDSSIIDLISTFTMDLGKLEMPSEKQKLKTILEKNACLAQFAVDALFLQVVSIFEFVYTSKFGPESKHDLKALCFLIIKKLTANNERVQQLASEIDLVLIVSDKFEMTLRVLREHRYQEMTKKNGVQKSQILIKDACLFLKALTEWSLPLSSHADHVMEIFRSLLKLQDWLNADCVLTNCFLNFVQTVGAMESGRSCFLEELNGKPLVAFILEKAQTMSAKSPHTDTTLALTSNALHTLKLATQLIEVRMSLKNSNMFSILEKLHPQLQKNRKTTWDDITVAWLQFFEFLSRFEDSECLPNRVALLCRLSRLGNATIKRLALTIIRNFSLKSSIGYVLLSTEDFKQTVDAILDGSGSAQEKLLILQTLLSMASRSFRLNASLTYSPLNRKLKDQLHAMESDAKFQENEENVNILSLTRMLSQVLNDK